MLRFTMIFCLLGGMAVAETEASPTTEQDSAIPACDACAARKNGKRVLWEYLAKKRAEEEAEAERLAEEKTDD
ncbi:MAG: hypothetical protein AAF641_07805 [Pseudomonadota bacterium]